MLFMSWYRDIEVNKIGKVFVFLEFIIWGYVDNLLKDIVGLGFSFIWWV